MWLLCRKIANTDSPVHDKSTATLKAVSLIEIATDNSSLVRKLTMNLPESSLFGVSSSEVFSVRDLLWLCECTAIQSVHPRTASCVRRQSSIAEIAKTEHRALRLCESSSAICKHSGRFFDSDVQREHKAENFKNNKKEEG